MRFLTLALLVLIPPFASGGETYSLFTWIPRWEQKGALERAQSDTGVEAWAAALMPGTYEVAVESSEITTRQIKLAEVPTYFERLPDATTVIWHVGWWDAEDGKPVGSMFPVPGNEHRQFIEEAAEKAKVILVYAQGDV